jgi:hypothetical protein
MRKHVAQRRLRQSSGNEMDVLLAHEA